MSKFNLEKNGIEVIKLDKNRFSAYTVKSNILLDMQQVEKAKALIERSIELGDERHSAYRQASNISHRLKQNDDAIMFAKQAVNAQNERYRSKWSDKNPSWMSARYKSKCDPDDGAKLPK